MVGIFARMKPSTEAMWVERIGEWTRSGQSATEFAEGKPFTSGTLTWAASRLRKGVRDNGKQRESRPRRARKRKIQMAEVIRRPSRIAPVENLVLEVGGARVSVARGFDRLLLRDVVRALRGEK
ncbi:MAG: hypothetical protein RL701_7676 [Pseudomonadota bacterium]